MNIQIIIVISLLAVGLAQSSHRRCQNTHFECDNGGCVRKDLWCNSNSRSVVCADRSDRRSCGSYYPNCARDQDYCSNNRKCIPSKWICDGYQDCSDGSDEKDCSPDGFKIKNKALLTKNGRNWILKQRRNNWGWEDDTHRAITALYLSNTSQFSSGDSNSTLMVKQLQIQLSTVLLKRSSLPMHKIALYIHSLLATCLNPRHFQYHDLVDKLKQLMETSDGFNPFVALALCNANSTLPTASVSKLIEIMNRPNTPETIESKAYAAMALICLRNRSRNFIEEIFMDFNDTDSLIVMNISDITSSFKNLQREDGSFGNLYTTALVVQALQAAGDDRNGWSWYNALEYMISHEKMDGPIGDGFLSTYLVLPALNGKSLVDLGNVNCTSNDSMIRNLTVREELDSINSISHKVSYLVWVGLKKEISFSTTFTVPVNTTFHNVMRLAVELDPRYRFKYMPYSWGDYIYSIFGIPNDPEAGRYWQLYQLKGKHFVLVDKAPDKVITERNGQYAYWFRPTSSFPLNGDTKMNASDFILEKR